MANLPIVDFLTERLSEYDSSFQLRKGTAFYDLFFKPIQFIVQPLRDEADQIQIAQSFRRILLTSDPDSFDEEAVDALANNLFVDRATGDFSGGVARVYYSNPVAREWPAGGAVFTGNNSVQYANPAPFAIALADMSPQIENGLYYYDIPVQALTAGNNDLDPGGLVSLVGDGDVISVTNKSKLTGGAPRETNTELINRVKKSIAVRDIVTGKGFNATLFDNFSSFLTELQPIGFGDDEMMRDIVYNTHIGGRVDGFVKTAAVLQGSKNFVGLLLDTTRQTKTSRNIVMTGTDLIFVGSPSIDRSNGNAPILQQVKSSTAASYTSTVDLTNPISLAADARVKIGIDGVFKNVNVAGTNPTATTRSEILVRINAAFGFDVLFLTATSVRLTSDTRGLTSQIDIQAPDSGTPAALAIFGVTSTTVLGEGPITFVENTDYTVIDADGQVQRIPQPAFVTASTGSKAALSSTFTDNTPGIFTPVNVNDVLTIASGPDAGDYRVLAKPTSSTLILDKAMTATASSVNYSVSHTGIKNGETVFIQYWFNPLSIDIGPLVKLDSLGKTRGVRTGRADQTITDVAFLRVTAIELIDPLTEETIGTTLKGIGGYGVGGYGKGPYGIGAGKDYYLVVNSPTERFSAFEDSYVVIDSSFQGFSFKVSYEYVPEVLTLHNFVRSESERVLDGDMLMRHFLPAYVSGNITYSVDSTDSSIPDNDTLTAQVKAFIDQRRSSTDLVYSEISQFIIRTTDPFDRYGTSVNSFTLKARIHNTNGSTTVLTGKDRLTVPAPDPFPKFTVKPLTPRISHWIADNLTLTRV